MRGGDGRYALSLHMSNYIRLDDKADICIEAGSVRKPKGLQGDCTSKVMFNSIKRGLMVPDDQAH